jgi:hypothetical protein
MRAQPFKQSRKKVTDAKIIKKTTLRKQCGFNWIERFANERCEKHLVQQRYKKIRHTLRHQRISFNVFRK